MKIKINNKRSLDNVLAIYGALTSLVVIASVAIYRFVNGDYWLSALEMDLVLVLSAQVYQNINGKKVKTLNELFVVSYMLGVYGAVMLKGGELSTWMFPAVVATYFLLSSRFALAMNGLFILGSVPILISATVNQLMVVFYPAIFLLIIFGYIFSYRSERQNAELRKLATEDALTHIDNRRSFNDKAQELVKLNRRSPQKVTMLLFDLDHFKKINDTYGHPVGDEILINIAHTVKSNIRITDYLYRYGGEEFAIIASNTSLANAGKLADFIRAVVEKDEFLEKFKISISIGVAQLDSHDDLDNWLHRTDIALYEAKSNGRNTVFMAQPNSDNKTYNFVRFAHCFKRNILRKPRVEPQLKSGLQPHKPPQGLNLADDYCASNRLLDNNSI